MMRRAIISAIIGFIMLAAGIGVTVNIYVISHVTLHASSPAEREILNRCLNAVIPQCTLFFTLQSLII